MTAPGQAGRRGEDITSPEYDTELRDCIVCPWCGHENHDGWEIFVTPGSPTREADCIACGRPIVVTEDVTITYSARKGADQ